MTGLHFSVQIYSANFLRSKFSDWKILPHFSTADKLCCYRTPLGVIVVVGVVGIGIIIVIMEKLI